MSDLLPLLSDLTNVNGVSGFEAPVARIVKSQLQDICEISGDNLGSVICRLKSSGPGPKVALAGHLDEIGFMVNVVTKEGFVKFLNLGGWWDQVLLAQRVVIETHKGPVMGVIGSKPPHILPAEKRNEIVKARDMFVDVGATSKEEAEALGIRPGDAITPVSEFTELSVAGRLLAKAWDDRVGVALFVHALQRLNGQSVPNELYGLGTVQEEVGLRGAATSAFAVQPDVCIVLETAIAGDVPGITEDEVRGQARRRPDHLPAGRLADRPVAPPGPADRGLPAERDPLPVLPAPRWRNRWWQGPPHLPRRAEHCPCGADAPHPCARGDHRPEGLRADAGLALQGHPATGRGDSRGPEGAVMRR